MKHPRDHEEYVRFLELLALITEDWGKVVTYTNDYFSKGYDKKQLDLAMQELSKIKSPMSELTGMMEIERRKKE